MNAPVILVVEDDDAVRSLVSRLIEGDTAIGPARAIGARDAEEALLVLRRAIPALILLDLRLPGMDGFELCRRLKRDPLLARVPIVATSALMPTEPARQRALDHGCADFVAKPFDLGALIDALAAQLHRAAQLGQPTI